MNVDLSAIHYTYICVRFNEPWRQSIHEMKVRMESMGEPKSRCVVQNTN